MSFTVLDPPLSCTPQYLTGRLASAFGRWSGPMDEGRMARIVGPHDKVGDLRWPRLTFVPLDPPEHPVLGVGRAAEQRGGAQVQVDDEIEGQAASQEGAAGDDQHRPLGQVDRAPAKGAITDRIAQPGQHAPGARERVEGLPAEGGDV